MFYKTAILLIKPTLNTFTPPQRAGQNESFHIEMINSISPHRAYPITASSLNIKFQFRHYTYLISPNCLAISNFIFESGRL